MKIKNLGPMPKQLDTPLNPKRYKQGETEKRGLCGNEWKPDRISICPRP